LKYVVYCYTQSGKNIDRLAKHLSTVKEIDDSPLHEFPKSVLIDILAEDGEEKAREAFNFLLKHVDQAA